MTRMTFSIRWNVRLSTRRRFSAVSNASSILTSPPSYAASPLASAIRPTSLAFYSAQATSKPRGGSRQKSCATASGSVSQN
jgi:hypothetical protein